MRDAENVEPVSDGGLDTTSVVKWVPALAVVAGFAVLAVQNAGTVDVDFLAWELRLPLILLMLLSAIVGVLAWELLAYVRRRRSRRPG